MKLCAIYNIWDDLDWLEVSTKNISPAVDGIIVVFSETSNYGEQSIIPNNFFKRPYHFVHSQPDLRLSSGINETNRRNDGLKEAEKLGYTHFITIDADELYHAEDVLKAKELFQDPELNGLVCRIKTYFKSPTLTIGFDTTLVPFIHKITPGLKHEFNRKYPFAWEGNSIRIDPTRSLNIDSGVKMCDVVMHHMSHVRKDFRKKIRNSTARANLEKSSIIEDYKNAKAGYFCKFYQKELKESPNVFWNTRNDRSKHNLDFYILFFFVGHILFYFD